jgi:hypothetical protein
MSELARLPPGSSVRRHPRVTKPPRKVVMLAAHRQCYPHEEW